MAKIKKGDLVIRISGPRDERGKTGRVLEVLKDSNRVIVEGLNRVTKHTKAGQSARGTRTGGVEVVEAPIHISNVQLYDKDAKRGKRIGARVEQVERDGRTRNVRVRVTRGHGEPEKDI
ncbi:50S ribosomal protein L24 [Flavimobilis marinus]|jgi:large subunit ribosomal protein L24|uniref:Large ribosomal subunit protein uL24 n=1 Tax=Flavimobilis marinus TaxID=285351 RepID=A0A1I2D678_9MICO|nr:50S ribosomal protein L24 [Flavimobilis marinus]GHG45957.1 50S ribosomal protein L24 [Flavimobilis marinus]SFE76036.1 LSU ribosomal protein L24P [Flavimobilis marinus]